MAAIRLKPQPSPASAEMPRFLLGATPADLACIVAITGILSLAYIALWGKYAFDDSFVGYSIAKSLLAGHGFTFNSGEPFLSTSAPLAVPLYAALSIAFRSSVPDVAQAVSAACLAVVAYGSYALFRRISSPIGAIAGASIVASSPFTLLLWSHETLLYAATAIVALNLYVLRAPRSAALTIGCASLFRGEALLLIPFLVMAERNRAGLRAAALFGLLCLLPYALWIAFAIPYFGGFLSETIASKQAQVRYVGVLPYVPGLHYYTIASYGFDGSTFWGTLVEIFSIACALIAAACGLVRRAHMYVFTWAVVATLSYVVLELQFYFWFATQLAVAMAASAAMPWPRTSGEIPRYKLLPVVGRGLSAVLVCFNIAFLVSSVSRPDRMIQYEGGLSGVMTTFHTNAYKSLGLWFARHSAPDETISFAEFCQLRYFSDRNIVDFLGLVTPGAARQLGDGNAVWTLKRYRPTWLAESAMSDFLLKPREYDWIRAAYAYETTLRYPGNPARGTIRIYRLRPGAAVPLPGIKDHTAQVLVGRDHAGLRLAIRTRRPRMTEIEARVRVRRPCSMTTTLLSQARPIASRRASVGEGIVRASLAFDPPISGGSYVLSIQGCDVDLAPAQSMRSGFVWRSAPPAPATPADAVTAYAPDDAR